MGLEGGWNRILYAEGNPLSYSDPTGQNAVFGAEIGGAFAGPPGAVAGAVIAGVGGYLASEQLSDWMESRAEDRKKAGTIAANYIERARLKSCPRPPGDGCDQQEARDNKVCGDLPWEGGLRKRCYKSAAIRYASCKAGTPMPPLITW